MRARVRVAWGEAVHGGSALAPQSPRPSRPAAPPAKRQMPAWYKGRVGSFEAFFKVRGPAATGSPPSPARCAPQFTPLTPGAADQGAWELVDGRVPVRGGRRAGGRVGLAAAHLELERARPTLTPPPPPPSPRAAPAWCCSWPLVREGGSGSRTHPPAPGRRSASARPPTVCAPPLPFKPLQPTSSSSTPSSSLATPWASPRVSRAWVRLPYWGRFDLKDAHPRGCAAQPTRALPPTPCRHARQRHHRRHLCLHRHCHFPHRPGCQLPMGGVCPARCVRCNSAGPPRAPAQQACADPLRSAPLPYRNAAQAPIRTL